jgi:hypothetical protein
MMMKHLQKINRPQPYRQIGGTARLFTVLFIATVLFSCENDEQYTISKPVIISAQISPQTFEFGDSVILTANIGDDEANLSALSVEFRAGDRIISEQSFAVGGNKADINQPVFVPLIPDVHDGTGITVRLKARNVLKGESVTEITGLTGNRPSFNQLYLVVGDNKIHVLTPQSNDKNKFETGNLTLDRAFDYRIAQKITGNQIDYSGLVWGNRNGRLSLTDETGEPAFAYVEHDYADSFVFDGLSFGVALSGRDYSENDIVMSKFSETTIDGEPFRTFTRNMTRNQEYTLFGELDEEIVYNPDFFEQTAINKVKFLGATGAYTIYYNAFRKHVIVGVENPAYPDFILLTGGGIGYPTKVKGIGIEHVWWGFGNVRNFILFNRTAENVYQGTMMIHAKDDSWVGCKPFENTGWGGEKRFDAFTFTGLQIFESADGGDWHPTSDVSPEDYYRITINWAANTVNVEKVNL